METFALIGAAGYIAPRHMQAIKATKNQLVAILDKSDSVGLIDSYFPEARFFTEFERFDRHLDKLRRTNHNDRVNFVSICSPNYLHDSHIRFALRSGSNAICEKPLVLNPWNIDGLQQIEMDTGEKIYTILQLRLHPSILKLKDEVSKAPRDKKHDIDLTYITSRGRWYSQSWKGDDMKSGGIATNIGVHFFDMLHFIFGDVQENIVHYHSPDKAAGYLEYDQARVRWFLSVDEHDLPASTRSTGSRTFRAISVNDQLIEFSSGFTDLHTVSYQKILEGEGFAIDENRVAIQTVSDIRNAVARGKVGNYHPYLKNIGV